MKHSFIKVAVFLLGIFLSLALFNLTPLASAQPQEIVKVTSSGDFNASFVYTYIGEPSLAIDSKGTWHLVYQESTVTYSSPTHYYRDEIKYLNSKTLVPVTIATATSTGSFTLDLNSPSIAIDSQDNPHVMYQQGNYSSVGSYYTDSYSILYVTNAFGNWSQPQEILKVTSSGDYNASSYAYTYLGEPSLAIDSKGSWHLVYAEEGGIYTPNSHTCRDDIKYLNSQTFTPITIASVTRTGGDIAFDLHYPSIAVDSQGNPHIMYQLSSYTGVGSYYTDVYSIMYINNISNNWSLPQEILKVTSSGDSDASFVYTYLGEPSLAIDSKGNWHVVYREAIGIYPSSTRLHNIKYLNSKTPPTPLTVSSMTVSGAAADFSSPSIATDSHDNLHIMYQQGNYSYNDSFYNDTYAIMYTQPEPLELLDGSEFSSGREISSIPKELATAGTPVEGAVTDGVTRLLLRLPLDQLNEVTFSLEGGTGNPKEDGILKSIDSQQQGNSIIVYSQDVNSKEYAFAVYQAPENFVRDSHAEDKNTSERKITLKVKSNRSPSFEFTKEIKLVRPPLILIHGLWSGPEMWDGFKVMLKNKIPGIQIFTVDYKETNASHLDVNKNKLADKIAIIRGELRSKEDIAMVQADVIGHSMGGILSRIRAGDEMWSGAGIYYQDSNFKQGDINKLITLDSPHFGSFLADFTMGFIDTLDPVTKNQLLSKARKMSFPLNDGAIDDLQTMSAAIMFLNSVPADSVSHAIVGDFAVNVDLSLAPGEIGLFYDILKRFGFNTKQDIIPGASDLVVSAKSQTGGLVFPASSTFNHHHCAATTEEIANKTIELLNTAPDGSSFESGFPINKWPEWWKK